MHVDDLTAPDVMTHLNQEVARLTLLLRAEREHNRRLMAGVALYRSGLEIGRTALRQARSRLKDEDYTFGVELEEMGDRLNQADALVIPTAEGA